MLATIGDLEPVQWCRDRAVGQVHASGTRPYSNRLDDERAYKPAAAGRRAHSEIPPSFERICGITEFSEGFFTRLRRMLPASDAAVRKPASPSRRRHASCKCTPPIDPAAPDFESAAPDGKTEPMVAAITGCATSSSTTDRVFGEESPT